MMQNRSLAPSCKRSPCRLTKDARGTRRCTPKFANTMSIGGKENSCRPYAQDRDARHTDLSNSRHWTPSARVSRRVPELSSERTGRVCSPSDLGPPKTGAALAKRDGCHGYPWPILAINPCQNTDQTSG